MSFSYNPDEPILKHLTFDAQPGQAIALVGPSGAGKSTIANLLPRFYDVTDGAILIDDHDIRDVTVASLREQVGIVPQETNLFNDTVYNNILYGRLDATRRKSSPRPKPPMRMNSSRSCPRAMTPSWETGASTCPGASVSALPLPGPS